MDIATAAIRYALFPAWVAKNRSARLRYLRTLDQTQFQSRDALRQLQWERLQVLLRHAFSHCAFYRAKFTAAGLNPDDLRHWEDLAHIPTTSKLEIQERCEEFISDTCDRRRLI